VWARLVIKGWMQQGPDATAEPIHALREIVARRHEDSNIHLRKPLL
jgi:hypothetical protein